MHQNDRALHIAFAEEVLISRGAMFAQKIRGQRRMPGTLYRIDRSLVGSRSPRTTGQGRQHYARRYLWRRSGLGAQDV